MRERKTERQRGGLLLYISARVWRTVASSSACVLGHTASRRRRAPHTKHPKEKIMSRIKGFTYIQAIGFTCTNVVVALSVWLVPEQAILALHWVYKPNICVL